MAIPNNPELNEKWTNDETGVTYNGMGNAGSLLYPLLILMILMTTLLRQNLRQIKNDKRFTLVRIKIQDAAFALDQERQDDFIAEDQKASNDFIAEDQERQDDLITGIQEQVDENLTLLDERITEGEMFQDSTRTIT